MHKIKKSQKEIDIKYIILIIIFLLKTYQILTLQSCNDIEMTTKLIQFQS